METPEVIAATNAFEAARNLAKSRKQAAISAAMKLKMPEHATAIRAAERAYHLALAEAAAATGLIDHAPYLNAAAAG